MKTNKKLFSALILMLGFITASFAQTDSTKTTSDESPFSINADLVNRYVFRGLDFGESPAIQPGLSYSYKNLTVGAWGSYAFVATPLGIEADLFASYDFDFGLSAGVTDYYFPGEQLKMGADSVINPIRTGKYFDYSNSHFFELNISQSIGDFYVSGNWGFSNMDNALYFEAGYDFKYFSVFAGGGNEIYTMSGNFNFTNIGLSATKEVKLTDNYSIPLSASVILNPNTEQIHFVVTVSL